jgi:type IV secretory pathway VirD2 relaxase
MPIKRYKAMKKTTKREKLLQTLLFWTNELEKAIKENSEIDYIIANTNRENTLKILEKMEKSKK